MKMLWIGVLLLPMVSTIIAAQEVQVASRSGNVSVDILASGADKSISYSDDKGQPISKRAFLKAITHGHHFSYKRDEAHQSTAFMLLSPDAKETVKAASTISDAVHGHYKVEPGQEFPAFQLATVDGGHIDSASLLGRPTVVHFFFAECVPCFAENPVLNAYAKKHPEVRVLAITRDNAKAAETYVQQRQLTWPVAYGGHKLLDALGVAVFPAMALVSADGRLLDIRASGGMQGNGDTMSERDLNLWVRRALSQQSRPVERSAQP